MWLKALAIGMSPRSRLETRRMCSSTYRTVSIQLAAMPKCNSAQRIYQSNVAQGVPGVHWTKIVLAGLTQYLHNMCVYNA